MIEDNFAGIGGSYVLDRNGLRVKVEGTIDKLDAPVSVDQPVIETAPSEGDAPAKEK
jgi:hypothetical protein